MDKSQYFSVQAFLVSLVGAATSIIFVTTNVLSRQYTFLVAPKLCVVATNIIFFRDKHVFVIFSWYLLSVCISNCRYLRTVQSNPFTRNVADYSFTCSVDCREAGIARWLSGGLVI